MTGGFIEDVTLMGNDIDGDIVLVTSLGHFDVASPPEELTMSQKAGSLLIEQYRKEYKNG